MFYVKTLVTESMNKRKKLTTFCFTLYITYVDINNLYFNISVY